MSSLLARRWLRIVLAAAAVLVLAGGAAIGSGLIGLPMTAESTPTPSRPVEPSATPTMPATVTPSATASVAAASPTASPPADPPTPAPTPTAYARPRDVLPIGAVIRATADGLGVRHGPSLNSELAGTVNAGDLLYIRAPENPNLAPRFADGYEWYPVEHAPGYTGWPIDAGGQEGRIVGYVAARSATDAFVELVPPDCPDSVEDMRDVVALTPYERVACLGNDTISVEGTFGCPFCDSLAYPYRMEPAWLATWQSHLNILVPSWAQYPPFPGSIVLVVPLEGQRIDIDQRGNVLRVTGHFDDERSADCTITPEPGIDVEAPPQEAVEWYCRERFVVESWEAIGTDPAYKARVPG